MKEPIPGRSFLGKEGSAVAQYASGALTFVATDGAYTSTSSDGAKCSFVMSLESIPTFYSLGKE